MSREEGGGKRKAQGERRKGGRQERARAKKDRDGSQRSLNRHMSIKKKM